MTKRLNILVALLLVSAATAMADDKVNAADTNADGVISKADATLIYSYILGKADPSVTAQQVDVNADGKVNTADVVEAYIAIRANADVNIGDWNDGGDIEGGKAEE